MNSGDFKIGNEYWKFRNKHGRDFKYTSEKLWEEAVKYFEWISEKVWNKKEAIKSGDLAGTLIDIPTQTPMSLEGFCLFADIDFKTFQNYERQETSDYVQVTTRIRKIIESHQFEGATVGAFNPNIIARKLGLTDRTDITSDGEKINTNIPSVADIVAKLKEE
jgi:DNA-packaging protein gp3